jgi:hypothetical protein
MTLDVPFWIKQRQAQVEDLGGGQWKITGPNLPDAVIGVRMGDNLSWQAYVRAAPDGDALESTDFELPTARDALAAAFELYRGRFVN